MEDMRNNFEFYKMLKRKNSSIDMNGNNHKKFDVVVIPESDSEFIMNVAWNFGKENSTIAVLEKRGIDEIRSLLEQQSMQKAEKKKLFGILNEIDHFSMHLIPGNQRWRFEKILFKPMCIAGGKSVLLLDDSRFSGTTMNAMKAAVSHFDECEVLFGY